MLRRFPKAQPDPGITRQVLADAPDLMVVRFSFAAGAEGRRHSHPHTEATYVASGRFRLTIADATLEVGPGDSFVIPGDTPHGSTCLEAGTLIDSFAPRREDFL